MHTMHTSAYPVQLMSLHGDDRKNLVLILLNLFGIVGMGLKVCLEGENQIWREKRILLYFQITIEVVELLRSEMETP